MTRLLLLMFIVSVIASIININTLYGKVSRYQNVLAGECNTLSLSHTHTQQFVLDDTAAIVSNNDLLDTTPWSALLSHDYWYTCVPRPRLPTHTNTHAYTPLTLHPLPQGS